MHISALSILCMGASAAVAIILPIVLLIWFQKGFNAKFIPALVGAASFILFALVFEQALHSVVLRPESIVSTNTILYILYATLAAGVFEETGRLISFLAIRRKYPGAQNALSYGVGHGGIEAVLIVGLTMVSNIALSIALNTGKLDNLNLPGIASIDHETLREAIGSAAPTTYLLPGVERIGAIALHIALSVLVYYAVMQGGRFWLYPISILLHALSNIPAALLQKGVITSILFVEVFLYASTALIAIFAFIIHKKLKSEVMSIDRPVLPSKTMEVSESNTADAGAVPVAVSCDTPEQNDATGGELSPIGTFEDFLVAESLHASESGSPSTTSEKANPSGQ